MEQCFDLGRELLGFKPNGPLKILYIQAENDDGDTAEMIAWAKFGLEQQLKLGDEEIELLGRNLSFVYESERMGSSFCVDVLASR